jgi:hypothetical protein
MESFFLRLLVDDKSQKGFEAFVEEVRLYFQHFIAYAQVFRVEKKNSSIALCK